MAKNGPNGPSNEQSPRSFYDRIADVHNLAMKLNGYRSSVAKYLRSLDLPMTKQSRVLDAGSGTGIVTLGFCSAGIKPRMVAAVDLSLNSLKVSRDEFEKERDLGFPVCLSQGNVLAMPYADETFDLVLTCGVLEYVPLRDGLQEIARVMTRGGHLVMLPVKPSLVGSVLELLYNFKTHPPEQVRSVSSEFFEILGNHDFPITEPISWSKTIFLLRKK